MSKLYLVTSDEVATINKVAEDALKAAANAASTAADASSTAANAAQMALNASNKPISHSVSVTLLSASWSNNTQTVDVTNVTADNTVIVSPAPDSDNYSAYTENTVRCIAQDAGSLTFVCESEPTMDVIVNVTIINE